MTPTPEPRTEAVVVDEAGRLVATPDMTREQAVRLLLNDIEERRGTVRHGEAASDLIVGLWRLGFDVVPVAAHPESDPATPQSQVDLRALVERLLDVAFIDSGDGEGYYRTANDVSMQTPKRVQPAYRALRAALRAVPAEAEEAPESAWLIEQGQPEGYSPPIYYALDQPRTAHYPAWTKDPFKARMFERRELAVAFMDSMRDGDRPMPGRPVEHGFIEGPVRPADASGGGEGLIRVSHAEAVGGLMAAQSENVSPPSRETLAEMYIELIEKAGFVLATPPAPTPASEDGLLHDTREAIQEATGAMAAALPVILAVRAWRDTPRVASKGETVRQLGNRLEQAILDAMDGLEDYAEAHPAALAATTERPAEPDGGREP